MVENVKRSNKWDNIEIDEKFERLRFYEKIEYSCFSCIMLVSGILMRVYDVDKLNAYFLIIFGSLLGFIVFAISLPLPKETREKLEEREKKIIFYSEWLSKNKEQYELTEIKRRMLTVIRAKRDLPRIIEEKKEECERTLEEYIDKQEQEIKEILLLNDDEVERIKKNIEHEIERRKEIFRELVEKEYGKYSIQSLLKTETGDIIIFAETERDEEIHFFIPKEELLKQSYEKLW